MTKTPSRSDALHAEGIILTDPEAVLATISDDAGRYTLCQPAAAAGSYNEPPNQPTPPYRNALAPQP